MSVTRLDDYKNKKKGVIKDEEVGMNFESIMKRNEEKAKRMESDRKAANRSTFSSYNIKTKDDK
jgi:hypothetical protein